MKRWIALLLVLLLVLSLAACGSDSSKKSSKKRSSKDEEEQSEKETGKTGEDPDDRNEPAVPDDQNGPVEDSEPEEETDEPEEPEPAAPQGDFEEIVAIDNDKCLLKITGVGEDDFWGLTVKVYLENRTSDQDLRFSVVNGAIDGVDCDPFFSAEVAAGKKMNDEIFFSDDELKELLPRYTDVELELRVYDAEDWLAEDVGHETVHIYPCGEENATVFVREPQPTDTVIVDNDNVSVIVIGYTDDSFWGYSMQLYLVNKTDSKLMFSADDVSVNGFMCDPYWACSVGPGKVAFSDVSWMDSKFEENGITEVEEIEMKLRVYNYDDWLAEDFFNETVTLHP